MEINELPDFTNPENQVLTLRQATDRIFLIAFQLESLNAKLEWILDHNPNLVLPSDEDMKSVGVNAVHNFKMKYSLRKEEFGL